LKIEILIYLWFDVNVGDNECIEFVIVTNFSDIVT